MNEINEKIIKALEGKIEIQAKMISELKTRVENISCSYKKIIEEQEGQIQFLRSELKKTMLI
tara:strand:- start:129 stop:314 length:186 start_codon:yes stop_codon:yes gene_type:complete